MNKIKVIDLLNMISKGEEVPRKIKYDDNIFDLFISSFNKVYYNDEYLHDFFTSYDVSRMLNDEVEIIEEDKKINYIECYFKNGEHYIEDSCFRVQPLEDLELNQNEIVIIDKINEIIKKINKLETK